jgi:hypothetical protein
MIDRLDPDYLRKSDMPFLRTIMNRSFYKKVERVMRSVTTVNNASIKCGVWSSDHGLVETHI